jgi:hypothetical protein
MIADGTYTVILQKSSFCTDASSVERILSAIRSNARTARATALDPFDGAYLTLDLDVREVVTVLHHDTLPNPTGERFRRTVYHESRSTPAAR